jgi:hypothetical protein
MANHPVDLSGLMTRALNFAARNHVGEQRRDYLQKVRWILAGAHITAPTILLAPVMLEVLLARSTSPSAIEKEFGPKVLKLVMELLIDPDLDESARRAALLDRASTLSQGAKVVLLATLIASLGALRGDRTLKENKDYIDWADNLAELLSGVSLHLDTLCDEMVDQTRDLIDAARGCWPPPQLASETTSKKAPSTDHNSTFLRIDAARGVNWVEIKWDQKVANVTIDNRQLKLSRVMGHSLEILTFFSELGEDGVPHLIDSKAFGRELGRRTGGTYVKSHHIRMQLYRLRQKLSENGVNPWLLEMPPRAGARFRCRRIAPAPDPFKELEELLTVP